MNYRKFSYAVVPSDQKQLDYLNDIYRRLSVWYRHYSFKLMPYDSIRIINEINSLENRIENIKFRMNCINYGNRTRNVKESIF